MPLNDINTLPEETHILIDTNIIINAALAHPVYGEVCKRFLKRIETREIIGYLPTIVIHEILHRFMITELIEKGIGRNVGEVLQTIKKEPVLLNSLTKTWIDIGLLFNINCSIIREKDNTFEQSLEIVKEYNLLAKDAYITAFAQTYNLSHIASNDSDFRRIPWLSVWRPNPIDL